jgi:hypothetical protein
MAQYSALSPERVCSLDLERRILTISKKMHCTATLMTTGLPATESKGRRFRQARTGTPGRPARK